jgi:hypothetical protein
VRLQRLANRIGPDMDRLRQAIAERIPPVLEAELAQLDALEWQWLEDGWARAIERDHRHIADYEERIKKHRANLAEAEPIAVEVRRLRADGKKRQEAEHLDHALCHRLADNVRS